METITLRITKRALNTSRTPRTPRTPQTLQTPTRHSSPPSLSSYLFQPAAGHLQGRCSTLWRCVATKMTAIRCHTVNIQHTINVLFTQRSPGSASMPDLPTRIRMSGYILWAERIRAGHFHSQHDMSGGLLARQHTCSSASAQKLVWRRPRKFCIL